MTAALLPWPRAKFFFPNTNYPLAGGKLYTYIAGTVTPLATYSDSAGTIPNTNPVILDANGEAAVYLTTGLSYKINLTDASGVQIAGYPIDNMTGADFAANQLRTDLANTANPALGVSLIPSAERVVLNIAALKQVLKTANPVVYVENGVTAGDGLGGHYYYDSADTTSANNDYSVVVAADGGRWKIIQANGVKYGNQTPVVGTSMKIDYLLEKNVDKTLASIGGIWPGGLVYTYSGVSRSFLVGDGSAGAPSITHFALAINNGSNADVVAGVDVATIITNSGSKAVFGRNIIVGADPIITNAKMVGLEIDIEPAAGATSSGAGAGIYINGFSIANLGPVFQVGGTVGARFTNGFLVNNIASTGAAFAAQSGLSCSTGVDLTQGIYSSAAIALGLGHKVNYYNGGSLAAYHASDSGTNLSTYLTNQWLINAGTNTENTTFMVFRDLAGTATSLAVKVSTGTNPNGAASTVYVNANSSTSRSINAGGTINASGADYAEYEYKSESCGKISKGQIIGFDINGLITDKWSESISFGVKSTNPNLVGGDDWHDNLVEPVKPLPPESPKNPPERMNTIRISEEEIGKIHAEAMAEWQLTVDAHQAQLPAYNLAIAKYKSDLTAYNTAHEALRDKVDRIAYCGKVPVNIQVAEIGAYIVPANNNGLISAISTITPSLEQYQIAVGRVRRILDDGRAEIVVKPI